MPNYGTMRCMIDEKIHSRRNDNVYIKILLSSLWLVFYSAYRVVLSLKTFLISKPIKT